MDLESIRHVLVVAEHQSFRRASMTLRVQQSAISRRVKLLEDELGVSLFERHAAGTRLTNAGRAFVAAARRIVADLDNAAALALAAGRGELGHITIGFVALPPVGRLRDLLAEFVAQRADIGVTIIEDDRAHLISGLHTQAIDVAFVAGETKAVGLDTVIAGYEAVLLAVAKTHPVASKDLIDWEDIKDEKFLVTHRAPGPEFEAELIRALAAPSGSPCVRLHNVSSCNLPILAGAGLGVALVCEASSGAQCEGVAYLPITKNGEPVRLPQLAVWNGKNDNPALRRFVSLVRATG